MKRVIVVGLVVLGGCGSPGEAGQREVNLSVVADCVDLEQTIRATALTEMNALLDARLASALQSSCRSYWEDDSSNAMPGVAAGGSETSTSTGGASQVSGTNNQVVGVDEADFIKNDNKYIYVVSGSSLRILQAWPAPMTKEIAKVAIEGTARKLFVQGDRALVYSSLSQKTSSVKECTYGYNCSFVGDGNPTKLTIFDISDRTTPRLVRALRLSGSYINARRIGDIVHTVVTSPGVSFPSLSYSPGISYCSTQTPWEIYLAFANLRAKNTKIINETPMESFVPSLTDGIVVDGVLQSTKNLLGTCGGFYRSVLQSGTSFTTIVSLDMTAEKPAASSTIVSRPGAIYASAQALYVAVPQTRATGDRWYSSMASQSEATTIHRFELAKGQARYAGSGVVKGRVLNQFSMDEWQGHLRIATTTGSLPSSDVHSTLSVLAPASGALTTVGTLDQIAPKEDIRSVRFDGERGFVVTFKKTDPLFVFDLKEPRQPTMLAELKIPGFSTYMQLMDSTHLLTIGYDASDQGSFAWFTGVLLQIFDVSDPTNPTLAHREVIGTRGSSSEALTNHLAFTYFPPKEILALPMTICEGGDASKGIYGTTMTFSGLMVYKVTTAAGFALQGKVAHGTVGASCSNWWTSATSTVKRSIIMDDYVFSVTDSAIKVNDLRNLPVDLVVLPLTP
jgi:uncharacterized secreted protein with C-terminal beta-propeller domain